MIQHIEKYGSDEEIWGVKFFRENFWILLILSWVGGRISKKGVRPRSNGNAIFMWLWEFLTVRGLELLMKGIVTACVRIWQLERGFTMEHVKLTCEYGCTQPKEYTSGQKYRWVEYTDLESTSSPWLQPGLTPSGVNPHLKPPSGKRWTENQRLTAVKMAAVPIYWQYINTQQNHTTCIQHKVE